MRPTSHVAGDHAARELTCVAMLDGDCKMDFGALGNRAALGGRRQGMRELGALEKGGAFLDLSPDRHGRALALLRLGRLFRHAADQPRVLLWRASGAWKRER